LQEQQLESEENTKQICQRQTNNQTNHIINEKKINNAFYCNQKKTMKQEENESKSE